MTTKATNRDEPFTIDVKRFYAPISVTATCPKCGAEVTQDLRADYLSYPQANAPFDLRFFHENDVQGDYWYHSWDVRVVLRVTLEVGNE